MREMGWLGEPEVDWDDRRVSQFRGRQIGRGVDNEPLAMPYSSQPEAIMNCDDFQHRLDVTPRPQVIEHNVYPGHNRFLSHWFEHYYDDGNSTVHASVTEFAEVAWIDRIDVGRPYRNHGIGGRLLDAITDCFAALDKPVGLRPFPLGDRDDDDPYG